MSTRHLVPVLLAAALLAGCGDIPPAGPEAPAPASGQAAVSASLTTSPVLTFADLAEVGISRLVRARDGVSAVVQTSGLGAHTATTVWIVIFNAPENCATSPCGEPDLFDPDTQTDVLYFGGHVVGGSGRATFAGSRRLGDTSGSLFGALGLPSPGLLDAGTAEIHFVVRSHGQTIPGLIPQMIGTFNGGCVHPGPGFPDPLPAELGAPGPNACMDVHFAIHQP